MVPPDSGWTGAAIWGSQPSVDTKRSQVYVATGNVYTIPPEWSACKSRTANLTVVKNGLTDPCVPKHVYQESVLAFDMETGYINWVTPLSPIDAWTVACGTGPTPKPPPTKNCPKDPGPDADFGMMPTLVPGSAKTPLGKDMLVIGQKSGFLYGLSAEAGTVFWSVATSPGGNTGGLIWGIAVDDSRAYYTAVNTYGSNFTLLGDTPAAGSVITNSAFGSASLKDGSTQWQTQSPKDSFSEMLPSVVGDVVLFGYTGIGKNYETTHGALVPVDKNTGAILSETALDHVSRTNGVY